MSNKKAFRFQLFSPPTVTSKPIHLNHKRIFILPSSRGLGFSVLILLLLMIAFVYNNNLAYLLSFLLASVFFITILHTFKSLSGLVISKGKSYSAYAGEDANFDVYIENNTNTPRLGIQIKLLIKDTRLNSLNQEETIAIAAKEKKRHRLYSPTQRRGWHECEKIIISSTYPLGLFRAWSVLYFDFKTLIYPKPSQKDIPFPENAGSQAQQGTSQSKGIDDFYGLKEYQAGDAIRHVHWKGFAKGQGLHTKQYSGENLAELWLTYDATSGHNIEERLSQLCRWLIEADNGGLEYGFEIPGMRLEPNAGSEHFNKCLKALALF